MSNNPDLLLVNPGGFRKKVYQGLSKDLSAIEPPFWAALTGDFIRRNGFDVDILDANAENLTIEESANLIEEKNPDLVNIVVYGQHPSASTPLMPVVRELSATIKQINPERKVAISGLHPSALPRRTIDEEQCDYVINGEGFHTLIGLLKKHELSKIPGLWYRSQDKINSNPPAENIKDLAFTLPGVAWDLLPMDKYRAHNWHCFNDLESRTNYAAISTTLGCPFSCSFCCINAPFGKPSYRTWGPEWALSQIDHLVEQYNIKNIKFIDELFVLKPEHFEKIAQGLIKRNYGLNIWAYARVDTTKEEHLETLKKAGINWLALGIESGDPKVRKEVSKGKFDEESIHNVVQRIRDHGINIGGNYIFGLPEDNQKTMQQTLDLAIDLNCEWANFYSTMAYPGSRLYKEAIKEGLPLPDSWSGYSQHSYDCQPLPTKHISSREVLEFRDKAFDTYFKNPKYLSMIERKFGSKTREHIEEMTKIKLKRKLLK
jgi:anaerobic magnesium-protoporphyrin IX monomethyl ester cyclase